MNYNLIISIVPQYCGELVTNTARDAGCPGGTVLRATATSANGIIQLFGFGDTPKDITYNIASQSDSKKIIEAIQNVTATKKAEFGILFSLPVGEFIKAGNIDSISSGKK